MLIDTHAHLNFNAYRNDADGVIRRSLDSGIWMINIGTQYETSKKAIDIAQKYKEGVYAAVGLHPIHLETGLVKIKNDTEEIEVKTREEEFDYEKYKDLVRLAENRLIGDPSKRRVVAIGEIGLDYYWRPKTKIKLEKFKKRQRSVLCQQLNLAKELNLPVVFHCRMAHNDLIGMIKDFNNSGVRGVIHCFTGTWEQAEEYLKMGFYLGFNGIIYKLDLKEIIKNTPLDKILVETDCPYLTPLPAEALAKAGPLPGRNEPLFVKYIAEEIAKIKNLSYDEISRVTTQNAQNLFNF